VIECKQKARLGQILIWHLALSIAIREKERHEQPAIIEQHSGAILDALRRDG
jgi:hypothetical protein